MGGESLSAAPGKNKKILSSMWNWVCYPLNCNSNFSESTFKEHWSGIRKVKILGKFYYLCKNLSCKSFQTRTQYHFPPFRCYFPYCWCQGEELSFHQTFIKTKTTSNVSATTLVCGVCRCIYMYKERHNTRRKGIVHTCGECR